MRRPATLQEYATRPSRTETASLATRPAATLARLPATANAAGRELRLAMRKTAAPDSIARGETSQEARVMLTVTSAAERVPLAIGAMARSSATSARELSCLTGRL